MPPGVLVAPGPPRPPLDPLVYTGPLSAPPGPLQSPLDPLVYTCPLSAPPLVYFGLPGPFGVNWSIKCTPSGPLRSPLDPLVYTGPFSAPLLLLRSPPVHMMPLRVPWSYKYPLLSLVSPGPLESLQVPFMYPGSFCAHWFSLDSIGPIVVYHPSSGVP